MAVKTKSVTVGTTATLLISGHRPEAIPVEVVNESGADCFVGGSDVNVTDKGRKVPATTGAWSFWLGVGDDLYAVVAAATQSIKVVAGGQ